MEQLYRLDFFFKQLVPKVKTYLKNSQQLLEMLKTMILQNSEEEPLVVSKDVKSMYTTG